MLSKPLLALSTLLPLVLSKPPSTAVSSIGWTVSDFTRTCPSTCTYNLTITAAPTSSSSPPYICIVEDDSSTAITNSFYGYVCNPSVTPAGQWNISWGYNPSVDSAVMTVLNTAEGWDSWFGYNNVSTVQDFEDVGPNAVYWVGNFSQVG